MPLHRILVIDSHTGGEPTRTVLSGVPDLGPGTMRQRLDVFRTQYDRFRSAIVNEPRGNDAIVGALLLTPVDPSCITGVVFFNNVGYLHMCGHGTIGIVATLAYLGKIKPGVHRIETPVGIVEALLHESGEVTITNVPSYRYATRVPVEVEGYGTIHGDIAWGGNWFFLTGDCPYEINLANLDKLTNYAWKIRRELERTQITGKDEGHIDHIELFGKPTVPGADSKNFVLCPGRAYDRSPCGTGTSAKLACLYADGKIAPGQKWRQESVIGSLFTGSVTEEAGMGAGEVLPRITGRAYVNAEATLLLDPDDIFVFGIRS